jgi:DNA-binding NtrC family response regulator
MVRERLFRDDLYYRVGVIIIELPPLRSYKDNLEILAQVFLQQAAERHGRAVSAISREALALLHAYDFPGNVRELKNALEHAVVMARGEEVGAEELPRSIREAHPRAHAPPPAHAKGLAELREGWLAGPERAYLTQLLERCDGEVSAAAKKAGITRMTFYRLMKKHGLRVRRGAVPV